MVQHLAKKEYSLTQTRNGNVSLLHVATSNGNVAMMDFLVQNGLDIHLQSDDLGAPIDWAVAYSQVPSAKYLFSRGAKINNGYRFY